MRADWGSAGITLARTFGMRGLAHRTRFAVRKKLRLLKHEPAPVGDAVRNAAVPMSSPFRADGARVCASADWATALSRADRVLAGEYQRYRWRWAKRPATADDWIR